MATINLGRIKPVFRGAYAGGTAYVVDDIVTHGNETFICIQAGTGNATSNASYWTKLAAKGADGSDGTNVATTLTTQGDILYRDGSGLQRLPKGTAGQVLKMNSGATAPEYGTLSSDFVKIASVNQTSDVSGINFESFINNSTYSSYYMKVRGLRTSSSNTTVRMLTGTNTEYTVSSSYRHTSHGRSDSQDGHDEANERWRFTAGYHANTGNDNKGAMLDFWLHADANTAATHNSQWCNPFYNSNSAKVTFNSSGGVNATDQTWTGIRLYADGGTIHKAKVELYGLK